MVLLWRNESASTGFITARRPAAKRQNGIRFPPTAQAPGFSRMRRAGFFAHEGTARIQGLKSRIFVQKIKKSCGGSVPLWAGHVIVVHLGTGLGHYRAPRGRTFLDPAPRAQARAHRVSARLRSTIFSFDWVRGLNLLKHVPTLPKHPLHCMRAFSTIC